MPALSKQRWVEEAAALTTGEERQAWAESHRDRATREGIETLLSAVLESIHVDRARAEHLAEAALLLAEAAGDPWSRALALRASGAARYSNNEYAAAVAAYSEALSIFEHAGFENKDAPLEIGKTLNSALQVLSYLGQYERALEWASRAKEIFEGLGDHTRLARLASNTANIYYRQDRPAEAIRLYEEALAAFRRASADGTAGSAPDIAAALSNIAVCRTSLGEFAGALGAYEEARGHCEKHRLTLLVAECDYNIAWLHYLRGDYLRAMDLYTQTRLHCNAAGDLYHLALCNLDESEIYLQLNMPAEGGELARRGADAFAKLGMSYEHAKTLLNYAQAEARQGRAGEARNLLATARLYFQAQKNAVSVALIDLEEAALERRVGRTVQAWRLCEGAYRILADSPLPGQAETCMFLSAQLLLDRGEVVRARETALASLQRLEASECRAQRIQAYSILARIEEAAGRQDKALALWESARTELENLRGKLWGENFRISFLKDKLLVYAGLARIYIAKGELERAYFFIEQAKSRSMVEMLALPEVLPADPALDELLKDLNADYRQLEAAVLSRPGATDAEAAKLHVNTLRERTSNREEAIARRFNALGPQSYSSLSDAPEVSLEDIRRAIPDNALLIEYYEIDAVFHVCLLDRHELRIAALAVSADVRRALRFFQLQISRMRMMGGDEYRVEMSARTADWHLRELFDALIAPIAGHIGNRGHLIIVPHGFLHEVPFHALFDGARYLTDRFTISFAPSASVLARCNARPAPNATESLVLGVPDERTPWIEREAIAVAESIPGAQLYLGKEATAGVMRARGPHSRLLHIATHGIFRRDHPLFSGIRLADSTVSLINLYRMPLAVEMATLSGCSTGLNAVTGADELLGLIRGILYAGARSVLASLWDVNDQSTTIFMTSVYRNLEAGKDKAKAVQEAMRAVREWYPHPYYWAPFILLGAVVAGDAKTAEAEKS